MLLFVIVQILLHSISWYIGFHFTMRFTEPISAGKSGVLRHPRSKSPTNRSGAIDRWSSRSLLDTVKINIPLDINMQTGQSFDCAPLFYPPAWPWRSDRGSCFFEWALSSDLTAERIELFLPMSLLLLMREFHRMVGRRTSYANPSPMIYKIISFPSKISIVL